MRDTECTERVFRTRKEVLIFRPHPRQAHSATSEIDASIDGSVGLEELRWEFEEKSVRVVRFLPGERPRPQPLDWLGRAVVVLLSWLQRFWLSLP